MTSRRRVAALALFTALAVASAGCLLYREYWPAGRDATGAVVRAGRVTVWDLRTGDCITDRFVFDKADKSVHAVPCTHEHLSEVYAVTSIGSAGGIPYPGTSGANDLARATCGKYGLPEEVSTYQRWFVRPHAKAWDAGDRRVICLLEAPVRRSGFFTR